MSRLALYRKWRPMTFDDVVEQRHVVDTLKNTIQKDAVGHAYLFCGTRGTGKTTMAKIFSRAINCLHPVNGNPCNECSVCTAIIEGSLLDVIEMDAASNNGVDNIRDIRDEVVYAPSVAKYKVYIIDEVHMLSTGAFNALLKTLEEPPDKVVFILATTEPQKLPATILSRCQRFDFKRITDIGIAERLALIARDCGIQVTDEALKLLSRLAGGALRDAISLLDQLTTLGSETIDSKEVNEMAGFASNERICDLSDALIQSDIAGCWSILDLLMREGRDLAQLCIQLISWFRNVLLLKLTGPSSTLLEIHPHDMNTALSAVNSLSEKDLSDWLQLLSEHDLRLRRSDNPRIIMEVLLLKLCMRTNNKYTGAHANKEVPNHSVSHHVSHDSQADRKASLPSGNQLQGESKTGKEEPALEHHPMNENEFIQGNERILRSVTFQSHENNTDHFVPDNKKPIVQRIIPGASHHDGNQGIQSIAATNSSEISQETHLNPDSVSKAVTVQPFKSWQRVIEEIQRTGMQKLGGMKLYAYIMNTSCFQVGNQIHIVAGTDDVFKKKMLSQSDSIEMIESALIQVTGEKWIVKIVEQAPKSSNGNESIKRFESSEPLYHKQDPVRSGSVSNASNHSASLRDSYEGFQTARSPSGGEETALPGQMSRDPSIHAGHHSNENHPIVESTGNEALDQLLSFGRDAGIPLIINEDP